VRSVPEVYAVWSKHRGADETLRSEESRNTVIADRIMVSEESDEIPSN